MKKDVDNIKLYMFFKISMGYKFTPHPPQLYAWTDEKILADIFNSLFTKFRFFINFS